MKAEEDAKIAALKQVERNRMNAQKDAVRQAGAKTLRDIDNQIQQAQNEAQVLEENAQRARGGKTFGEWQRGERDLAREQRIADNR